MWGDGSMKYLVRLTSDTRVILSTGSGKYLCHWRRYSPKAIFKFVLRMAWDLSNFPIVCGCLVVAHLSVMPKIWVISATTVEVNTTFVRDESRWQLCMLCHGIN